VLHRKERAADVGREHLVQRQRESFPSARIELLEGLGHWPFLEDPARVAEHVIPFLREQLGRTGSR
jgi:pimeloyl-ACP methyl ester carboxylesterase